MKIEGSQTIAAPRDRVWAILMESGRLSPKMPHYQLMVTFDGRGWRGTLGGNDRIHLHAQDQTTIIHYKGDIRVAGQLAICRRA